MQESYICWKWFFCFPLDVWILFSSCLSLQKQLGLESASPATFPAQVKKKKQKKWIGSQEKKIQKTNIKKEPCGCPKGANLVVVQRWEAKGMFQSAPALSFPITSWIWPCGVQQALILLLTQLETAALVAELRKCALEGLQDKEKKQINSEPHGVTFIVTSVTAATLLYMALSKQFRANVFLAVGRGCSFQHRQTQCKGKQRTENRMAHYYLSSSNYTYYSGGDRTNKCATQYQKKIYIFTLQQYFLREI